MDPEFVESATVDSFVDGFRDWEVQLLVRMHFCQNITTALAYALEVEAARRALGRMAMVFQLKEEYLKEPKSSSSKEVKPRTPTYFATRRMPRKKLVAQEVRILQFQTRMSQHGVTS